MSKDYTDNLFEPKLNQESLYGLAGDIVKLIEPTTEADPAALLISFLTSFGNILGNSPHMKVEADLHPGRLFTVIVGKSSKSRKGTSFGRIEEILSQVDPQWHKKHLVSGLSTGEGIIKKVNDQVIDKRLLIIEPEFVRVLSVMNRKDNILSPIIRQSWDKGNLSVLTRISPLEAKNANISILAHITIEELSRNLSTSEKCNGFANRFLWFFAKRSKKLPFGSQTNIEKILNQLIHQLKDVVKFSKNIKQIQWAEETKPLWEKAYGDLSRDRFGLEDVILSRAEAQILRLNVIFAILDKSTVVKKNHLKASLAIWDYVEQSIKFIFNKDNYVNKTERILTALKSNGGEMTRTDISHIVFNNHVKAREIDEIINEMEENNIITRKKESTSGRDINIIKLRSDFNLNGSYEVLN